MDDISNGGLVWEMYEYGTWYISSNSNITYICAWIVCLEGTYINDFSDIKWYAITDCYAIRVESLMNLAVVDCNVLPYLDNWCLSNFIIYSLITFEN